MAQQVIITAITIGGEHGNSPVYQLSTSNGTNVSPSSLTLAQVNAGYTVTVDDEDINSLTVTVTNSTCSGYSKVITWDNGNVNQPTPTPTPTPTVIVYPPTPTPTPTPTEAPCPGNITVVSSDFIPVNSTQTYRRLGGWCMQTFEDTEGELWYIDATTTAAASSGPDIYIFGFSGGSNSNCPPGTDVSDFDQVSSFGTVTPAAGNSLYETGIQWADRDNQEYYVLIETAYQDRELVKVHLVPTCATSTTPAATPTPTPTPVPTPTPTTMYFGLVRCDGSGNAYYTTTTDGSYISSGTIVHANECYRSEGQITNISGKTYLGVTVYQNCYDPSCPCYDCCTLGNC